MTDEGTTRDPRAVLLPGLLASIAEGAWVAVIYDLIQLARGEPIVLGPVGLALFAIGGWQLARTLGRRVGTAWPAALVGLTVAAGALGWLLGEGAASALLAGDPARALVEHQAGWLAGLAFLRGTAHAHLATSERSLRRLLAWGTPALAIPLFVGQAMSEPARSAYQLSGMAEAFLFFVSASVAIALARVARLGAAAGFDPWRNAAWLALLGLVVLLGMLTVPAAFVVVPSVQLAVALLLPLFLVFGLVVGIGRVTLRQIAIVLAVGVLMFVVSRLPALVQPRQTLPTPSGAGGGSGGSGDQLSALLPWLPVLAAMAVIIALLGVAWMRTRTPRRTAQRDESRAVDATSPPASPRRPRSWPWTGLRRRWTTPTDAASAYLATLEILERDPDLRRRPDESPAAHARRLRRSGAGSLGLELLAADYELARFGDRPLSESEQRRAIARWRRLRAGPR